MTKTFGKITKKELSNAVKNDNISHFICRLAYCRNEDLRKWFATQETRLFFHRLASFKPDDVLQVLKEKCKMDYKQLHHSDMVWVHHKDSVAFQFKGKPLAEEFIRVPFKDAINLVSQR